MPVNPYEHPLSPLSTAIFICFCCKQKGKFFTKNRKRDTKNCWLERHFNLGCFWSEMMGPFSHWKLHFPLIWEGFFMCDYCLQVLKRLDPDIYEIFIFTRRFPWILIIPHCWWGATKNLVVLWFGKAVFEKTGRKHGTATGHTSALFAPPLLAWFLLVWIILICLGNITCTHSHHSHNRKKNRHLLQNPGSPLYFRWR